MLSSSTSEFGELLNPLSLSSAHVYVDLICGSNEMLDLISLDSATRRASSICEFDKLSNPIFLGLVMHWAQVHVSLKVSQPNILELRYAPSLSTCGSDELSKPNIFELNYVLSPITYWSNELPNPTSMNSTSCQTDQMDRKLMIFSGFIFSYEILFVYSYDP
jgi:hypothetical protein